MVVVWRLMGHVAWNLSQLGSKQVSTHSISTESKVSKVIVFSPSVINERITCGLSLESQTYWNWIFTFFYPNMIA